MKERYMKERFERMTLDQLDAIHEVLCYLYPPMESIQNEGVYHLVSDLDEVRTRKRAEYLKSDEYKQACEEADANFMAVFGGLYDQ